MASILSFGRYLPERVLDNATLAARVGCEAGWIFQSSGIEERRIADAAETVAGMAERAALDCLQRAGLEAGQIGLIILATGTAERRFPGPAAQLGEKLGRAGIPAIDLPVASAGSLFAMALAAQLAPTYGTVLVAAAEKMSGPALSEPPDRNVAILFGDGAGACLVSNEDGQFEIVDSVLHSDGAWAEQLSLELSGGVQMDGRAVILQAARRVPAVIGEVLSRQGLNAACVGCFLMHQANRNLMDRVAKTLGVPASLFFSNISLYGNTSSASLLIAASERFEDKAPGPGDWICFSAFGAGFHWGALLARKL